MHIIYQILILKMEGREFWKEAKAFSVIKSIPCHASDSWPIGK